MRLVRHVARIGDKTGTYRVLVGRQAGTRPLGSPMHIWEDSMYKDLEEVGCRGMEWIDLARKRDRWRGFRVP